MDSRFGVHITQHPADVVPSAGLEIHGVGVLKVYSLLEHEMDALGATSTRLNVSMSGTFLGVGSLISAILGCVGIDDPTKHQGAVAMYTGAIVALGLVTILCGILWISFWRERRGMVTTIKARSATPVKMEPVARSAGTPPPVGSVP